MHVGVRLNKILEWLANGSVGASSKTIALTALGRMPDRQDYPHDPDDFSRCFYLLEFAPNARTGLVDLGQRGNDVWKALVPRWDEIAQAYLRDKAIHERGEKSGLTCYDLMKSIIRPIEDASGNVIRTKYGDIHKRAAGNTP